MKAPGRWVCCVSAATYPSRSSGTPAKRNPLYICSRSARYTGLSLAAPARNLAIVKLGTRRWATARTSAASASSPASASAPARTNWASPQFGLISTDLRRLSDSVSHSPEIDLGDAVEEVPMKEERIARA